MKETKIRDPYSAEAFTTVPTKLIVFSRKCILRQMWRFVVLNLKIMRIIIGGHS